MKAKVIEVTLLNEEFKTIEGYTDYEVSNLGRVKSLERIGNDGRLLI
jgi:hypothetical protein